jgi:hypothetical protein
MALQASLLFQQTLVAKAKKWAPGKSPQILAARLGAASNG